MEPKYRTLLQAAIIAVLLAVLTISYEPEPEIGTVTAELSVQ